MVGWILGECGVRIRKAAYARTVDRVLSPVGRARLGERALACVCREAETTYDGRTPARSARFARDRRQASLPPSARTSRAERSTLAHGEQAATRVVAGDGAISWDFGDGTTETHPISARFTHTFLRPGVYQVRASVTDNLGNTYAWTQSVQIDTPLAAAVDQNPQPQNTIDLTARAIGGQQSNVLAAHWTFTDGTTADGTTITMPHKHLDGSVTITDGAGNTATTSVHIN